MICSTKKLSALPVWHYKASMGEAVVCVQFFSAADRLSRNAIGTVECLLKTGDASKAQRTAMRLARRARRLRRVKCVVYASLYMSILSLFLTPQRQRS